MRSTLGHVLSHAGDIYRGAQRAKATIGESVRGFLAQDAAFANNVTAKYIEWFRNEFKACPAVAEAITPMHFGLTQAISNFTPREKAPSGGGTIDIDTLATLFGNGTGVGGGAMRGALGGR